MTELLRDFWYLATAGQAVAPGQTRPVTLLGEQVLVGRRTDGLVFAFGDACPHRGMPMRHGSFDGVRLRCGYHGWAFETDQGRCSEIPSLAPAQATDPSRFRLHRYAAREVQGNIWVWIGAGPPGEVPVVPGFDGVAPRVSVTERFHCNTDLAVAGFIDPGHPAFVHTSRWWKSKPADKLREKAKTFTPDGLGFRMARHHLKHGANPYRMLGRNVHIDIAIQLPGIRTEHIQGDRYSAGVLAAATPVSATETDVHYCVYWTVPWLGALRPAAWWMARDFLRQDRDVANRMMENPSPPASLYVGDPDTQIRWYQRLKRELAASRGEGRAFVNPLVEQTLLWKS